MPDHPTALRRRSVTTLVRTRRVAALSAVVEVIGRFDDDAAVVVCGIIDGHLAEGRRFIRVDVTGTAPRRECVQALIPVAQRVRAASGRLSICASHDGRQRHVLSRPVRTTIDVGRRRR